MKTVFRFSIIFISILSLSAMAIGQKVLIVYYSVDGHTEKMAKAVAEGAQLSGKTVVRLQTVQETTDEDLLWADAVIVGTPVHVGNVAGTVQSFLSQWPFENQEMKNKIGAAFATGGGLSAGEELAQLNILHSMLIHQMIIVGGPSWNQPFGASAVTGEGPYNDRENTGNVDEYFLNKGKALGERVVEIVNLIEHQ